MRERLRAWRFRVWLWWRGPSTPVVWPEPVQVPPRADLHNPEFKVSYWDVPALLEFLREGVVDGVHVDDPGEVP